MSQPQVPAARNVLRILALLSTIDVPISAARIRTELGLPRSSTYHLLNEMVESGFVVHLPEQQTYGLGLKAYAMAQAYTTQQPLVRLADKALKQAASVVGGSAHLSRLAGSEILYLHELRSPGALSLVTNVGVRLQATRTASGRIMLAHLPDDEAKAAFATAEDNAMTLRAFRRLLEEARCNGYAEENQEVSIGQRSVAVAVLDHLQRPAAALAVTFPSSTAAGLESALNILRATSHKISATMYGQV